MTIFFRGGSSKCAYTVWYRAAEFDTVTHRRVSRRSATPFFQETGPKRPRYLWCAHRRYRIPKGPLSRDFRYTGWESCARFDRNRRLSRKRYDRSDLYTVHSVVRFGDMDTSAGRSTEARGLPHAFPTWDDPRDTLARLCQKHRSCRPDQPSLCSRYHRQETKFIVRPCGETRWPHASPPRIITGRSSKNWPPFWSWLAATARTPAPFIDPADRRLNPSAFVPNGPKLVVVATLGWRNGPLLSTRSDNDDDDNDDRHRSTVTIDHWY